MTEDQRVKKALKAYARTKRRAESRDWMELPEHHAEAMRAAVRAVIRAMKEPEA